MLELFVIAGIVLGGVALVRFWDDIKNWLNTVAADAVEKMFGYEARKNIQKAVAIVDKLVNRLKNTSIIYSKNKPTDTYFNKTTVTAEANISDIDEDVIKELDKNNGRLTQTLDYIH